MNTRRPNILFLFPDQHRPDWTGANSGLPLRTPTIDRLCATGVRFDTCYANSPLCAPARACLASGRRYDRCGVPNNGADYPLDQPTYYQLLRDGGYEVLGCGKFDLHKDTLNWGLDGKRSIHEWGFTDGIDNEGKFDGSRSYRDGRTPKGPYLAALAEAGIADAYEEEHQRTKEHRDAYTTTVSDDLYCDNWLTNNGLELLSSVPLGTPWHLVVNFTGPHNPMDVTPTMRSRWKDTTFPAPHANEQAEYTDEDHQRNRQNYAAMIENIDQQMSRLIEAVETRGELENTVIIFSSDHGEMLGDHSGWGKSTWRWPSAQVPLVISAPEGGENVTTSALTSTHDLAATILDYAGIAVPDFMDARSLRPVVEGTTHQHRDVIGAGLDAPRRQWRMMFDGRYKLVVTDDQQLFFDLESDPWEDDNIAGSGNSREGELATLLQERGV